MYPERIRRTMQYAILLMISVLTGCSTQQLHNQGAAFLEGFVETSVTQHMLTLSDVDQSCQLGSSMGPVFFATHSITDAPPATLSLLYLLSANCSEQQAFEAEFRSLRALQDGRPTESKDARTAQKRWLKLTAERRNLSFKYALEANNYPYDEASSSCPTFTSDQQEMVFLLGLLTGLQAIISDAGAEMRANVPRNIAAIAARASYCLDDQKWGGSPASIRSAIWVLLPGLNAENQDAWAILDASSKQSLNFGIRIPVAIHATMAETSNNLPQLEKSLSYLQQEIQPNPDYSLLDAIALSHITAISDRIWTQAKGERTPFGRLGFLPDHVDEDANDEQLDDLL
ncbi:MAG: hypothetical protein MI864_03995 [Pseudomonadales bacterium]|nr:hypothetical protein [Pseudomonadales bacterium]